MGCRHGLKTWVVDISDEIFNLMVNLTYGKCCVCGSSNIFLVCFLHGCRTFHVVL